MAAITSLDQLDPNGSYTYADYLTWQFNDWVELIKGRIYKMSPAPLDRHQATAGNLHAILYYMLRKHPCTVRIAPSDVRLTRKGASDKEVITVVQPDIYIVCDASKMDERGCNGAPDLVVEIMSPGSSARDLGIKKDIYAEAGVPYYWVAFPKERMVLCHALEGQQYRITGTYAPDLGEPIPFPLKDGELIDIEEVFEGVR